RSVKRCFTIGFGKGFAILLALRLGDAVHGDDLLTFSRIENGDALCGTARQADIVDRNANDGPTIRHQHDLVTFSNGERCHELADLVGFRDIRCTYALAPTTCQPEIIRRRTLAVTELGHGEHKLLMFLQELIAL